MHQSHNKTVAGVWLDKHSAILISHPEGSEPGEFAVLETIKSKEAHSTGSEHSQHNAENADQKSYFKSLEAKLLSYEEILIFGPGKIQEQFLNILQEEPHFKSKKITIDSADHMTDPQMVAKVRDYFSK